MNYERYDLIRAFEGEIPQAVLQAVLRNYRNIKLIPPIKKRIVLVAEAGYHIGVVSGNKDEEQPFVGAYKYSGLIDESEVESLRADPTLTVEYSGDFNIEVAPDGSRSKYVQDVRGIGKDYIFSGAIILLEEGQQQGDFEFAWHREHIGIEIVSGDLDAPMYRVTGRTPEEAEFWSREMLKKYPNAKVNDDPSEEIQLELLLKLSDKELLKLGSPRLRQRHLKSYRKHLRRRLERIRLGKANRN